MLFLPPAFVEGVAHFASWIASNECMRFVIPFLIGALVSLALTPVVRAVLHRVGMEDMPGGRRINKRPLPRGGGVAVFIAFHAALACTVWITGEFSESVFDQTWRLQFLTASGALLAIGLADDAKGLKPWVKLLGQLCVAAFLYAIDIRFERFLPFDIPKWLDFLLTLFWFAGAMNAMNLIDGMDGLASGLALIACAGISGSIFLRGSSTHVLAIPYLALAGACLGFLRYNFHPSSIILGDCGSMFLGITLAALPLMTASRNEFIASLCVPLMALGIPIFDTLLAIWRRSLRAVMPETVSDGFKSIMLPDKSHIHHRVLKAVLDQRRAAWILYGINTILVGIGLAAMLLRTRANGVFMLAFVAAIFVAVHHLNSVELWDSGRILSSIAPSRITYRLRIFILMGWDICALVFSWCLAFTITDTNISASALASSMIYSAVPSFIAIAVAKGYRRIWRSASMFSFAMLFFAVLASSIVSYSLHMFFLPDRPGWIARLVIYTFISASFVCGGRQLAIILRETRSAMEHKRLMKSANSIRAIACGAGTRFGLLVRERQCRLGNRRVVIAGVLDDDLNLRGRMVAGHCILGTIDDLRDVVEKNGIGLIMISAELPVERREFIVAAGRELGIPVIDWSVNLHMLHGRQTL